MPQHYEALYVLDGDWNTKIVVDIVSFMRQVLFMPPVIVVGVPNVIDEHGNTRDHDFTPTVVVADRPHSGGAADFLSFLNRVIVSASREALRIRHSRDHRVGSRASGAISRAGRRIRYRPFSVSKKVVPVSAFVASWRTCFTSTTRSSLGDSPF